MTFDRDDDEVKLGYKNPPPWSRFKKGRSGNPKGRPRKKPTPLPQAPNESAADDVLRAELVRKIRVNDVNGSSELDLLRVIIKAQANQAAKGNVYAQREILKQARALEERDAAREAADEDQRRRIFKAFIAWRKDQQELWTEAERKGIEPTEPWPHPDDMHVNKVTLATRIHGPSCEEELPMYDYYKAECVRLFVQAELKRREESHAASFSALDMSWLQYDLMLPKRWRINDDDDAWRHVAIRTTPELEKELEEITERAEQLRKCAKIRPFDKDDYRLVNETLKPLLKALGFHSLAHLESIHGSDG